MMRLPKFRYVAPTTLAEAAKILKGEGSHAMLLAGGTDLFPNMKRRQQVPKVVIGLRGVCDLYLSEPSVREIRLGPMMTLADTTKSSVIRESLGALYYAADQVATPQIRNMGTLGGNLCLDTRCNYYDQSEEWRKAIDYCMKKDGKICWVAPSSPRCWAVSSTDAAPALIALSARVRLVSASGDREIPVSELFADDGMKYLTKRPDEILADIRIPIVAHQRSTYWKLRRRGSFDFPILSVAASVQVKGDVVEEARVVLGSVASRPLVVDAVSLLRGKRLTDDAIEEVAQLAYEPATPMDNTDFELAWRKKMVRSFVSGALKELRGDVVTDLRLRSVRELLPTLRA